MRCAIADCSALTYERGHLVFFVLSTELISGTNTTDPKAALMIELRNSYLPPWTSFHMPIPGYRETFRVEFSLYIALLGYLAMYT